MLALVAMVGLNSCSEDCDHVINEHDHSADFVGTWTCLREDFAEALVIKADGSVLSTGSVFGEEYWEDVKGNIVLENGNITMTFEDGDNYEGHFDIIPGMAFSIYNAEGRRFTYDYCANDLAEEILGMWVCNDIPADGETEMMIETFHDNGKSTLTGFLPLEDNPGLVLNNETDYNVVGDLLFVTIPADMFGGDKPQYVVQKLIYTPNGTAAGDIMTFKAIVEVENQVIEGASSWLRIKQNLELPGMKYDYIKTFISNVKGLNQDVPFFNTTINFANFDSSIFDMFLNSTLFSVNFPDANTLEYSFLLGEQITPMQLPIMVEGNKMTIKMSEINAVYRDVEVYTFQDQDNTQMHMYMPTSTFENFFGNMQVNLMAAQGQLDMNDAAAVNAVYDSIDEAVESINLSLVMTRAN